MADYDGEEQQDQGTLKDDEQDDQNQGETPDNDDQDGEEGEGQDEQTDEVVITIGEEAPPHDEEERKAAPEWVKELRKADREKAKRIRELEQMVEARQQAEKPVVTAKPTLADSDFDEDDFAEKLTAWNEQQRAVKAEQESKQAEERKAQDEWQERVTSYNQAKAKLPVSNYDEVEETVQGAMTQTQLGIILTAAEKPEQFVYAIGTNPARLKELASITNPVKFSAAVGKLETQMKVTPRKAPPAPERTIKGNTVAVGVRDSKLDRLEAEADKTNDRSALIAYRKQLKAKANA